MMRLRYTIGALLILLTLLGLALVRRPPEEFSRTALLMGTLVEIRAAASAEVDLEQAVTAAFAEMGRLDRLLSSHRAESEISRLSASPDGLRVSPETADLLRLGQQVARRTDGAFDMTLGAVKQLWELETEHPRVPTEDELSRALRGTGPEALSISSRRVTKRAPWLQVDLGGIAKGYAVDRAVAVLRRAGVESGAVNAGGDMRLLGGNKGRPWAIGVQHPRSQQEVLLTLKVRDRAVVTSGDYERYFMRDGIRYHHIFDPTSGRPARLCRSVTVVAKRTALADALATAAFVLGPERGLRLLNEWPDVEGLLVAADGRLLKTDRLPE